jgi:hypothetical protein
MAFILTPMPFVVRADATSGTWVIEDEVVEVTDCTLVHEGIIVIRGAGRLVLVNSTLRLKQLTSWQFSIRLEDSGVLSLTNSQLAGVYPYRVTLRDNSSLVAHSSAAAFVAVRIESTAASTCTDSSFLQLVMGTSSNVTCAGCSIETASVGGGSWLKIERSQVDVMRCRQDSVTILENSTLNTATLDDTAMVHLAGSDVGEVWCWTSSSFLARDCSIERLQYYDAASITVEDSSMDSLVGAGLNPVTLDSLTIREVVLTGVAYASLIECVSDTILCDWYSTLRFINGSCEYIEALEWANVSILGAPSLLCNVTRYGAFADTCSHIAWARFHTIELGHRTRTWISDSSAYTIQSFAYEGPSPIYMTRCVIDWELRMSWGVVAEIQDSRADNVLVYGESSLNASGCEFLAIMIGEVDDSILTNCTIGALYPAGKAIFSVVDSEVCFGIQPDPHTSSSFVGLPTGNVANWNSLDSGAIGGLVWNITIVDSLVTWRTAIRYDAVVELRDSDFVHVACGESCIVTINNVTTDSMVVTNYCDVTMYGGAVADLDCGLWSTSVFENVSFTDIFTIDYAEITFRNCTCSTSLAGGFSMPRFENCTVYEHRASGSSSSYIQGSTLDTLFSYDGSVNYCYDSEILSLLSCSHHSRLTISGCNISSLATGNSVFLQIEQSWIGDLLTQTSTLTECTDSTIVHLETRDYSQVLLSGNLTGLTSYSLTQYSTVVRQMVMIVTDGEGQALEGALIQVYDSINQMILEMLTQSDGSVGFEILFTASNSTLLQIFSFNVSLDGRTTEGLFVITDNTPIRVTLESVPPPSDPEDAEPGPILPSDRRGLGTPDMTSVVELIILIQCCAVAAALMPPPIHLMLRQRSNSEARCCSSRPLKSTRRSEK